MNGTNENHLKKRRNSKKRTQQKTGLSREELEKIDKALKEKLIRNIEIMMANKVKEIQWRKHDEETLSTLTKTIKESKKKDSEVNSIFRQLTVSKLQRMEHQMKTFTDKTKKEFKKNMTQHSKSIHEHGDNGTQNHSNQ